MTDKYDELERSIEEPEPIPMKKESGLPCPDKVEVPEMKMSELGWSDHLYLGARRATKVFLHVGGVAAGIAGLAIMKGVPAGQALLGAGLVAAGSAATTGVDKLIKEKRKVQGKRWFEIFDLAIGLVRLIYKLLNRKEKVNHVNGREM